MTKILFPAVFFVVIAALTVHGPWGAKRIAHKVETAVAEAMTTAGHEWASVQTFGQTTVVAGVAPDETAMNDAQRTAMTAIGPGGPFWGAVTKVVMRATAAPALSVKEVRVETAAPPEPIVTDVSEMAPSEPPAVDPAQAAAECEILLISVLGGQHLTFSLNNASLTPEDQKILRRIAAVAAACGPIELIVEGHTDNRGSPASNLALSRRRAESVRDFLSAASGQAFPIAIKAFGESEPVAPNNTRAGREANRRIEFAVAPAFVSAESE